jgi:hypothetical protein
MLKVFVTGLISLLCGIIFFMIFCILIRFIQMELFLPEEHIMLLTKFPASRLIFIYEFFIIFGLFYALNKNFRETISSKYSFKKKHRRGFCYTFLTLNIVLLYPILFGVTAITKDKVIDHKLFLPFGKTYEYNEIVKINTGVYGKKLNLLFLHAQGDFYYVVEFKDGTKIDLTQIGGSRNDANLNPSIVIEKLDKQFVDMGISKVSSMENFEYYTEHLNNIYIDKIRNILENVKR